MQNPRALRRLARRCRNFETGSTAPPVATQLRLWAVELADAADDGERAAIRQFRGEGANRVWRAEPKRSEAE
jgi:hypothetical protein